MVEGLTKKRGPIIAENGVVAIVALEDERLAIFLRQQAVASAEVPAARPLAKISADGGDVANLRAGGVTGCGRQHGMLMLNLGSRWQFYPALPECPAASRRLHC